MSIFGKILSKIMGHKNPAAAGSSAPPVNRPAAPAAAPRAPAPVPMAEVDVEAALEGMAKDSAQKLDWRHSIVDLMKLVGMESSLAERKELAQELGYTGAMDGSAAMNTWLHKEVLRKLSQNGGKVPANLLD